MSKKVEEIITGRDASNGKWLSVKTGERSTRIMGALNNRRFKARTIEGIAKEIGINRIEVVRAIKSDAELREKVKLYRRKASDGRMLVTTKKRFSKEADIKDKFIDVFSSREVNIDDV